MKNEKDNQQPYAVIVGVDDYRGIYAARTLARHKVPTIAIAKDPKSPGSRSNTIDKILYANTGTQEVIRALETLGPELNQKAVLFPCFEQSVLQISRHRQRLEKWYHVILPSPEIVEAMIDKPLFYSYAHKGGFVVPQTFALHDKIEAEKAIEKLTFPCILKPDNSKDPLWQQHTRQQAFLASSKDEFLALYDQYHKSTKKMVAQEWVEGSDANFYMCQFYFNADSEPIVSFGSHKLRQWPPLVGHCSLVEESRNEFVLRESVRFFRSIKLHGLGEMEMKVDKNSGKYFIIEPVIGRPPGYSAIHEAGGVELLYTMYCDTIGWPLPENNKQKFIGVKYIFVRRDILSAFYYWRRGELTIKEWWQSLRGRKVAALFSLRDPGPFFADALRGILLLLNPQERRNRRQ
jgi:D-aspartate ligase